MVHSVSRCMQSVQVKLWDSLRTHAIPECLIGVITTRCYTNPRLPLPYLVLALVFVFFLHNIYSSGCCESGSRCHCNWSPENPTLQSDVLFLKCNIKLCLLVHSCSILMWYPVVHHGYDCWPFAGGQRPVCVRRICPAQWSAAGTDGHEQKDSSWPGNKTVFHVLWLNDVCDANL